MKFWNQRSITRLLLVIVLTGITVHAALGQTSKGTLVGTARDTTGAVIPHADIKITDQATGAIRVAKTDGEGGYRFDAIDPGPYTISVSTTGFDTFEVKGVQVEGSIVTSYGVTLKVGKTTDVISVEADNATINTENGQLAGVISAAEIDKLPIFSLNPVELALTVPGVQPVTQGGNTNGENIQVNGARPRANNFLLDGQEINDVSITGQAFQPQIPDSYESVTVITNSASAEYGRAGGGVVNLITKSGTNTFHGTGFERYAGSGLASVPGGNRGTPYSKARQDEHSYGFTVGGPIIKNKLFAFGAWEEQRTYGKEEAGINLLPDAAGYATLQTITGPAAAQVTLLDQYLNGGSYLTADNVYLGAEGGAVTNTTLGGITCATNPCTISLAGFQRPNQAFSAPDTQWEYRVDFHPWQKDSFAVRYLHDRQSFSPDFGNNGNALVGFDTLQGGPSELAETTWTHVFSPRLLNEFRASEVRINFQFAPTPQTLANPLDGLATLSFSGVSGTSTAGSISFPSLGPNQNFPQGRKEDLYQFQDTITYTKGKQTIRAGVDIGRIIEIDLVSQNAKGTLTFNKGGSGVSALGNFLNNQLGPSGSATKTFGLTRADSHGYRNGAFVQDDIKFTSDLTVNVGLRYDFLSNPENSLPYPGIDPSNLGNPINTPVKIQNDYNNFAPRLGFAYTPHGNGLLNDGKTVIRGGFGVFYDSTFSNILVNSTQSSPNAVSGLLEQTTGNGLTDATSLIPSISPQLSPFSSVLSEDKNLVNPLTYQYNLGVERELPGQIVLGVRYVGNRGSKLFANQQYNYFSGATGERLDPTRGAITARGNYADSEYNGAEISGSHHFKRGLDIRANYVFSKDLSDGDDVFAVGSPTSYTANLAPGGRRQDWSNSAFDHRQFFSVAYVWQPKGLHSDNGFANAALSILTHHWTVSGITQLQSGQYTTINEDGIDANGDGSAANDRPVVSNSKLPLNTVGIDSVYIDGSTPGTYYDLGMLNTTGNEVIADPSKFHFLVPYDPLNVLLKQEVGRNSLLSPGSTTNNLALEKGIGLSYLHFERGTLILRAEASNFGNHNDTGIGDSSVLDVDAGFNTPTRVGSNRTLILWAKLQF